MVVAAVVPKEGLFWGWVSTLYSCLSFDMCCAVGSEYHETNRVLVKSAFHALGLRVSDHSPSYNIQSAIKDLAKCYDRNSNFVPLGTQSKRNRNEKQTRREETH